jgi:hypothetical protein
MWTRTFWTKTAERAVKTIAQAALSTITVSATGILDADWLAVGSVAALAGVVSVLTSIVSSGVADSSSPSLIKE